MAAPKEKSNVITAIVFDTETGGLDCQKCGVIQVSFHAVRLDTFEVMEKLNIYIKRYSRPADLNKPKRKVLKSKYDIEEESTDIPMEYNAAAEKVHGITKEMQERLGLEPAEACQQMIDFIKRNTLNGSKTQKPFFIGQNPMFDEGMIQQLFVIAGYWEELVKVVRGNKDFWGNFHFAMLDTIIVAQLTFNNDPSIGAWKLELSAERFGIEMDDAHDADADVTATREIVRVATARMRENSGNSNEVGGLVAEKQSKLRDHFKI
jgi:DNA polymerase III epsilon subunit-like protein